MDTEMSESGAPYFSILLPTKNRSHIVGYAIRSVLQQDFDDYELIICDNDDDPLATWKVVKTFSDFRIKYRRTGGLDMVSNWNAALDEANGSNVIILEDKMIFYPAALKNIQKKIKKSPSGIVIWRTDTINDTSYPPKIFQNYKPDNDSLLSNEEIIEEISKDIKKSWSMLPRGLSCTVPRKLISEIIEKTGIAFYEPVSPDFISAVKVLNFSDKLLKTSSAYSLVISIKSSNGRNVRLRKNDNAKLLDYYQGSKQIALSLEYVPIKSPWIVSNSLINDYRSLSSRYGGKILCYPISHSNYLKMLLKELLISSKEARKIVWNSDEVIDLVSSEKRYIFNITRIFGFTLRWLLGSLIMKAPFLKRRNELKVYKIAQDPLIRVEHFLDGVQEIGCINPFNYMKK